MQPLLFSNSSFFACSSAFVKVFTKSRRPFGSCWAALNFSRVIRARPVEEPYSLILGNVSNFSHRWKLCFIGPSLQRHVEDEHDAELLSLLAEPTSQFQMKIWRMFGSNLLRLRILGIHLLANAIWLISFLCSEGPREQSSQRWLQLLTLRKMKEWEAPPQVELLWLGRSWEQLNTIQRVSST